MTNITSASFHGDELIVTVEFFNQNKITPKNFQYSNPYDGLDEVLGGLTEQTPELTINGNPGDHLLPENMVVSVDPVESENLSANIIDLGILPRIDLPSVDGNIWTAYFTNLAIQGVQNPYGSADGEKFSGVRNEYPTRSITSNTLWNDKNEPVKVKGLFINEGQSAFKDAQVSSLGFFWVVAVLPRRLRNVYKNIMTRNGVRRIQMKDAPHVIVRWLDDEFQSTDKYSVMPVWALMNVKTGEKFYYTENRAIKRPINLRREFRSAVFERINKAAWYWQDNFVNPKQAGLLYWKVRLVENSSDKTVAVVNIKTRDRVCAIAVRQVAPDLITVPPLFKEKFGEKLTAFVLQAVSWKRTEHLLLQEQEKILA
jgi:hypothetical protein